MGVAETVRVEMKRHKDLMLGVLTTRETKFLRSFAQKPDGFFDAEPTLRQAQAPQSSELFGILKQMRDSFETNLASSQKEETENTRAYQDMKAAKDAQISAGSASSQQKQEELADTDEKNARSKVERENAQESLEADTKFLADLKEKCAAFDNEYEERTKTRQAEVEATTKALELLTSDEATDLFAKNYGPSFLQKTALGKTRAAAAARLLKAAVRTHDPRLSSLAVRVRLDSFGKVKGTLTNMVDRLVKEKDEEVKQKDMCVSGFNKNEKATSEADRTKLDLVAKIEDLQMAQDTLTKDIATLKGEIAEMQKQMKYAGDNREMENHDFNLAIADQVVTQKLLSGALNILKGFYEKKPVLAQSSKGANAKGAQPAGFKKYEKSEAGGGVIEMIKGVINESKMALQEAQYGESDAQTAYENFVKDSNASIEEKTKDVVNKIEVKGKVEAEKVEKSVQRDETLEQLQQLADELHDLHVSCDYMMKNWEVRTEARDEEVEALNEAIGMFSGASFSDFLQKLG